MSKSVLYAGNSVSQSASVINFGSVVRRYGCNCNLSGGNATVKGSGYYKVTVNLTVNPTAAGTFTVNLYDDGVVIPNANASFTATANDITSVVIPAVIRETCDCEKTITAMFSGVTANITNAAILVEKL